MRLRRNGSASSRALWGVLLLCLAGIIGGYLWSRRDPASVRVSTRTPLRYGSTPAFLLTDQNGQLFDSARLKGSAWIADFIFTSCAGSCPEMSRKMAQLQDRLGPAIQFVSISVDPDRDTPPALAAYAGRFKAQPGRWHFLTGDKEQIRTLVQEGFGLSLAEGGSPEEPITHSIRFVLVDRGGAFRGFYDSTDPKALAQLAHDANTLD